MGRAVAAAAAVAAAPPLRPQAAAAVGHAVAGALPRAACRSPRRQLPAAGVAAAAVRQALRRACSCKNPDSLCDALPGGGKAKGKKEKIKTADELDAELESYQKAAAAKAAKACRCYATPSAPMPLFAHALLPRQGVKPDAAKLDADMEAYMSAKPAATAKVAAAPAATDAAAAALAQAAL